MKNLEKSSTLCMCIPTYNRDVVIRDFLNNCAQCYLDVGIDIYIYDSSTDNKTKKAVDNWNNKTEERIYYISMPSDMHANMKVYKIWQFYGIEKKYDFVWVCGDALQYSREDIQMLMDSLKQDYDLIELDGRDYERRAIIEYTDYNLFLKDAAWQTTLFGAVVLNVRTVLQGIDWDAYEKKYNQPSLINFSHVSLYFNRIAEISSFKCLHLPIMGKASLYKKESGWHKELFFIMCDAWVHTIDDLPECYTTKSVAIKQHGEKTLFQDDWRFVQFHKERLYTFSVFLKYRRIWKRVCDIPIKNLLFMALLPSSVGMSISKLKKNRQIRKFASRYDAIYLYGAGVVGDQFGKYLERMKIPYEGYLVTKKTDDHSIINWHRVVEIDTLKNNHIGIIITVSDILSEEIKTMLIDRGYEESQIYYNRKLYEWIRFYLLN